MLKVLAITAALGLAAPAPAPAQDESSLGTISVTGTGSVSVAPDMATLRIGVVTEAESAAAAVAANSEAAKKVIATLKAKGIAPKDIQTANFSVSPVYRHDETQRQEGPTIVGYRAANEVVARVRNLDSLGEILDAAVSGGANRIDGLEFGLSDPADAEDNARAAAVRDAKHRAQVYAEAAGIGLGEILEISEAGGGIPVPKFAAPMRAEAMAVPIEAGETTVTDSVRMVWELLPPE